MTESDWTCPVPGHPPSLDDGDTQYCPTPGCLRTSDTDDQECRCEEYGCTGDCCGPWRCTCSIAAGGGRP